MEKKESVRTLFPPSISLSVSHTVRHIGLTVTHMPRHEQQDTKPLNECGESKGLGTSVCKCQPLTLAAKLSPYSPRIRPVD